VSKRGSTIAARARALVGVPFRPQGRDPRLGLDCVGVAAAAVGATVASVPARYAARDHRLAEIGAALSGLGCRAVERPEAGDVVVCRPGRGQHHLLVCAGESFVHADARLRRVAERPMPPPWPVVGIWRLEAGEE
jgi:cell wall-associated NlpC family hydrolase